MRTQGTAARRGLPRNPGTDGHFEVALHQFNVIRGASPLGLPCTLSRSPLRRLPPFAWLARDAPSHEASPLGLPSTLSRSPLRRLPPFAWLARDAPSHEASPLGLSCTLSRSPLRRLA